MLSQHQASEQSKMNNNSKPFIPRTTVRRSTSKVKDLQNLFLRGAGGGGGGGGESGTGDGLGVASPSPPRVPDSHLPRHSVELCVSVKASEELLTG